jgi:hypothetical protein
MEAIAQNQQQPSFLFDVRKLKPHSERDYDAVVAMLNAALDASGDDENHPLREFINLLGDIIEEYEQDHSEHFAPFHENVHT